MNITRRLGIWMDHANAHLMEFASNTAEINALGSKFTDDATDADLSKGESLMHNKEQHAESVYYKELGKAIANYDEVLLFGPTEAKVELFNLLRADRHFESIKIDVEQTDRMTDNQQHAYVKEYFTRHK